MQVEQEESTIPKPNDEEPEARRPPHHERIEDPVFRRAVELLDAGDEAGLRGHLSDHPGLVRQRVGFEGNYFTNPSLLEFVAENPIRHGRLPPNIVAVAKVILEAGGKTEPESVTSALSLVASGLVPRECGVQVPLIELLCAYGADPAGAMLPALAHAEFEAAEALIAQGAKIDLVVAAATGREPEARASLPTANAEERHRALALAAQHGHAAIVALLLDTGEDPDRFNPEGCHAHSTPLHQAALAGHAEVVRALVEHGASFEIRDKLFGGTVLGWAEHGGNREIASYLRNQGSSVKPASG